MRRNTATAGSRFAPPRIAGSAVGSHHRDLVTEMPLDRPDMRRGSGGPSGGTGLGLGQTWDIRLLAATSSCDAAGHGPFVPPIRPDRHTRERAWVDFSIGTCAGLMSEHVDELGEGLVRASR